MPLTRFPKGVLATPNLGAGERRLIQLWESDNLWYVDGDEGSSSNSGESPDASKTLVSAAVTLASRNGTIYVKPRTTAASAQTYYVDNITVPITKPGLSIIGAGNATPNSYAGVQLKPSTVGDHLIQVNGASLLLENMRLTLTGGTAAAGKSIVHAVNTASNKPAGLTVRGCWFANDKTNPGIGGDDATAAIGLALEEATIEDCVFFNCLGSIAIQSVLGSSRKIYILRNIFSGDVGNRDCDLYISINAATCSSIVVWSNVFSDGLPAAAAGATKRFINFPYVTAGVGCICGNYFSCQDMEAQFGESGSQAIIADNFNAPGNFVEGSGTTAPYGIVTT